MAKLSKTSLRVVTTERRSPEPAGHCKQAEQCAHAPPITGPTPSEADIHANQDVNPHEANPQIEATAPFAHERLAAYQVALQMAAIAGQVAAAIPRGHRNIADHMLRAASNCVLLLAEGANRRGAGEKRQRFVESRGEAGEVAAAADLVVALNLSAGPKLAMLKQLAARVAALTSGLIRHVERRPY